MEFLLLKSIQVGIKLIYKSNAYLRDSSAWYHLVIAVDTTQATASNRIKMYINGNQVTSLSATDLSKLKILNVI
jgi:hypothetical protein